MPGCSRQSPGGESRVVRVAFPQRARHDHGRLSATCCPRGGLAPDAPEDAEPPVAGDALEAERA